MQIRLLIIYIFICEHSEVQSHPPCHGRSTVFVVMRMRDSSLISTMLDYHEEQTLKASEKAKPKTRTDRLQETPQKR